MVEGRALALLFGRWERVQISLAPTQCEAALLLALAWLGSALCLSRVEGGMGQATDGPPLSPA